MVVLGRFATFSVGARFRGCYGDGGKMAPFEVGGENSNVGGSGVLGGVEHVCALGDALVVSVVSGPGVLRGCSVVMMVLLRGRAKTAIRAGPVL